MGPWCQALWNATQSVWGFFFPEKLDVPECVRKLLEHVYPTVDWDRVGFYRGFPWFVKFAPPDAITLPDFYVPWRANIYFNPDHVHNGSTANLFLPSASVGDWSPCDEDGLGTIVHEGFHILQMQDVLGGVGAGFVRPYIIQYLAQYPSYTYAGHPYEAAAFAVAADRNGNVTGTPSQFEQCYNGMNFTTGLPDHPICECTTGTPVFNQTNFDAFVAACPNIVQTSSGFSIWTFFADMWRDTPGMSGFSAAAAWLVEKFCWFATHRQENPNDDEPVQPGVSGPVTDQDEPREGSFDLASVLCGLGYVLAGIVYVIAAIWFLIWFGFWTLVAALAEIVQILFQIVGLIATLVMTIVTGIVCFFEWLWGLLQDIWNWIVGIATAIWDWFEDGIAGINDWAEGLREDCEEWENARECDEWEDQGYEECTETRDEGYNECSETEDQGYRDCCNWWPCSWLCDAWVWVSNIVCVAWTWVSNIVCVVWTWVEHLVCVSWTWTIATGCFLFTGAVIGLTGWADED